MTKTIKFITLILAVFILSSAQAEDELSPLLRVAVYKSTIKNVESKIETALKFQNFQILGSYHPGKDANLYVIAFTRSDLKNTVVKVKDRGALASVLKVGIYKKGDFVYVTIVNPLYMFNAYLMSDFDKHKTVLNKVNDDLLVAMGTIGKKIVPFGGSLSPSDLRDYHYKVMMPYFTDPVELKEFESFEKGLEIIRKSLAAKKGSTVKVYEVVYKTEKVAVFGVGLLDKSEGEAHFLPIIGDTHVGSMPYEIILQDKTATILHGRYRIALYWPDLTMGTFTNIMSTPGDIEDALEALTEE